MITCEAPSAIEVTKQAFLALYDQANANSNDPALLREDTAALLVTRPDDSQPAFILDKTGRFRYTADYTLFTPGLDDALIGIEEAHYTGILGRGQLNPVVEHLSRYPDSRRSVVSVWSSLFADPKRAASPCLTHLYFRCHNDRLELHSHFRANDAYRLLLMDMQLGISVQYEVAGRLGLHIGRYVHFTDSLHFYRKDQSRIDAQRRYLLTSRHWKAAYEKS